MIQGQSIVCKRFIEYFFRLTRVTSRYAACLVTFFCYNVLFFSELYKTIDKLSKASIQSGGSIFMSLGVTNFYCKSCIILCILYVSCFHIEYVPDKSARSQNHKYNDIPFISFRLRPCIIVHNFASCFLSCI